jgi:hypothetical protein
VRGRLTGGMRSGGRVGVARRGMSLARAGRVRGLAEHAGRLPRLPAGDRDLLVASVLDRLAR